MGDVNLLSGSEQKHVVVITNMHTGNIGNQALSTELIRLVNGIFAGCKISVLGRSIAYMGFSMKKLKTQSPDAIIPILEEWVQEVLEGFQTTECNEQFSAEKVEKKSVKVRRPGSIYQLLRPIAKLIKYRAIVSRLTSMALGSNERMSRLCTLKSADLVLYNPAGEINPHKGSFDVPLRQFLELLVAKKLGCRVVVVNHSVELSDPFAKKVVEYVYNEFDSLIIRDEISHRFLADVGVSVDHMHVVPDIAILAENEPEGARRREILEAEEIGDNTVGIAINYYDAEEHIQQWEMIIEKLQKMGKKVIFVSNALPQDKKIGLQLKNSCGITVMSRPYDYQEYIKLLSGLDIVISNRLHTLVFALVGNTPVIPVEPNLFKIDGLCKSINYPLQTVLVSQPDWNEAVIQDAAYIYANYADFKNRLDKVLRDARGVIREAYENVLMNTIRQKV